MYKKYMWRATETGSCAEDPDTIGLRNVLRANARDAGPFRSDLRARFCPVNRRPIAASVSHPLPVAAVGGFDAPRWERV